MTQEQFLNEAKKWINHKLILAKSSHWYKIPYRKAAVLKINEVFGSLLITKTKYSAGQLAILLKRYEGVLEVLLPIPQNPSYQNSLQVLNQLIQQAETIINNYNLEV